MLNMNLLNDLEEKMAFASFETFDNYLCQYLSTMTSNEIKEINIPLKTEKEGSFQAPASAVYLYFNNVKKEYNDGLKMKIVNNSQKLGM
jgi:alpha-2-macroglobulin-like protein